MQELDEYLRQAKEEIRSTPIANFENKKTRKQEVIEECTDYYAFPFDKQPFYGQVIKLSGDEMYILFQKYSNGRDAYQFVEAVDRIDRWLHDKPYKVASNWQNYLTQWIMKG